MSTGYDRLGCETLLVLVESLLWESPPAGPTDEFSQRAHHWAGRGPGAPGLVISVVQARSQLKSALAGCSDVVEGLPGAELSHRK